MDLERVLRQKNIMMSNRKPWTSSEPDIAIDLSREVNSN